MGQLKKHLLYKFKDFQKLFIARIISSTGDKFFTIALAWFILSKGGEESKLVLGTFMAINMLPVVILGPLMGTFVDKFDKKKCMLLADFVRFILVLQIFIALQCNFLSLPILYICCFFISVFIPLFESSVSSSLELLTDSNTISQAVAMDSSVIHISNILGALIGGLALVWIKVNGAILLNALSFLFSLLLILGIKTPLKSVSTRDTSINHKLKESLQFIYENKPILSLMGIFTLFNLFAAPLLILMPLIVKFVLLEGASWVGYFETFLALGAGLMSFVLSFKKKYSKVYLAAFISMVVIGAATAMLGIISNKYLMCGELFIIGLALSVVNTLAISLFQVQVPPEMKGRFFGILTTVSFAVTPFAYIINSFLSKIFSIPTLLIMNGSFSVLLAFLVLVIPRIKVTLDFTLTDEKGYVIRKMTAEDAEGIAHCVYCAYGNSYIGKHVYNPEIMWNLNKEGVLLSFVAVNEENEVIGHLAIEPDENINVSEISCAFVHPEYRGNGCLSALTEAAIEECKKQGFIGCYVHAVTTHPYSQKAAQKLGFIDCALVLSRIPALNFKGIWHGHAKRENLLVSYLYLEKQQKKIFYAPKRHKEIIKKIYKNLNIDVEFKESKSARALHSHKTRLDISIDNYETAVIYIKQYGSNGIATLLKAVDTLHAEGKKSIFIKLNLSKKWTPHVSESLEKYGMFFSGVMPSTHGEDELILQYIQKEINYEEIFVHSQIGNELKDYIIKNTYYLEKRRLDL